MRTWDDERKIFGTENLGEPKIILPDYQLEMEW